MSKYIKLTIVIGVVLATLILFYCLCLNHVDINEIGIAYNCWNGKVTVQEHPGFYLTSPTVLVVTLSTLPRKVSVPSAAVVINTKIVRFKPEGVDEFIRLQGFSYGLAHAFDNILMGYAFSGKSYPFLEIMQEAGPEQINQNPLRK